MTTATVAQPSGNQFAVLLVMFLLVSAITCVALWVHEQRWDAHDEQIGTHDEQLATLAYQMPALLEYLGIDIPPAVVDDSPAAEEQNAPEAAAAQVNVEEQPGDDAKTDEIPVCPPTQPDGIAIQVQSALIERPTRDLSDEFPHPVDSDERKAKNAADIEERLKQFNFTGGRR
jgi:hypothetical protein